MFVSLFVDYFGSVWVVVKEVFVDIGVVVGFKGLVVVIMGVVYDINEGIVMVCL